MKKLAISENITKRDYITCGLLGWCFEVFWTGMGSCINNDPKMTSTTSLLMFPIYAMAVIIKPVSKFIKNSHIIFRGVVYTMMIFIVEYTSGSILKAFGACPWNYEHAKYNISGLVRLDYAPAWFAVGLIYEKLLNPIHGRGHAEQEEV